MTKANLPSIPSNIESYRVAIEKEMEEYTAAVYFDQSRYSFAVFAEGNGEITINISAKNINLPNYWYAVLLYLLRHVCLLALKVRWMAHYLHLQRRHARTYPDQRMYPY